MKRFHWLSVVGSSLVLVAACERKPVASPAQGPAPEVPMSGSPSPSAPTSPDLPTPTVRPADAVPAAPGTVFVGPLSFVKSEAWLQQPPSSKMRLAEFQTADGCSIVMFDDLGAIKPGEKPTDEMVKANIDRWTSQVQGPDGAVATPVVGQQTSGSLTVTTFESNGTLQDGMPGGVRTPKPGSTFRGVVIRTPDDLFFVRMTGSTSAMDSHKAGWDRMIETLRVN